MNILGLVYIEQGRYDEAEPNLVRALESSRRVFGEEHPDSDIDLIADFGVPVGFFGLIRFENALAEFFGRSVDLVTEPGLSPFIRENVLSSAATIFNAAA